MKRCRKKDDDVSWEDPNKLKIAELQKVLLVFGIRFDKTERRTQLFQRYVQLARDECPESVELWTGQDSLKAPLPAADKLVVPTLKIFLALHAVDYPAQASRGHLIKLYNSIPRHTDTNLRRRGSDISIVIPLHREQKKRKTTSKPISTLPDLDTQPKTSSNSISTVPALDRQRKTTSNLNLTLPALHSHEGTSNDGRATLTPSNAGKILRKRGRPAVFAPYNKPPTPPIATRKNGQISRSSRTPASSRILRSTVGGRSHEPSRSLPRAREKYSGLIPSNGLSERRRSKSNNQRTSDISHDVDDHDNHDQSTVESKSCVSSVRESSVQQSDTTSSSTIRPRSPTFPSQSDGGDSLLPESQEDERATASRSISSSREPRTGEFRSQSQSLLPESQSQEDELASCATEVPSPSENSVSRSQCSVGQSSLPESQEDEQEDELASCTTEVPSLSRSQCSVEQSSLPESREDDLVSSTTEVPSLSENSISTRCSRKSHARCEPDCDDEDELASSAIDVPTSTRRSVEDVVHDNETESQIDHSESCFPTSPSFEGASSSRQSPRLMADQRSRSTNARPISSQYSTDLQDNPERSGSESCISNGPTRKTPIRHSKPSIEAATTTPSSLAAESTSSADGSDSTIVPSRQAKESAEQPTKVSAGHLTDTRHSPVPEALNSHSLESSSVSDQSEELGLHSRTNAPVEESSEVENPPYEEDSTHETGQDESQYHSDANSASTHHEVIDQAPEGRNGKVLKRKAQDPSKWPDASQLTRAEIEAYLDEHDVLYNRGARIARLVGSYNLLRSNLSQRDPVEPVGKRRRTPRSSVGSSVRDSRHSKRSTRRRKQKKVVSGSDTDDAGFVYSRPESSHHRPVSPVPSSLATESNYEPSVAPTLEPEPSVADFSEPSISTRSTRTRKHRRDSPTANTSKKLPKKNSKTQGDPPRKRGRPRKPAVQRKFRLTRAPPTSNNSQADINSEANFCPLVHRPQATPLSDQSQTHTEANYRHVIPPAPGNYKKHRLTDFSPSPDRTNRTCHVPHVGETHQPDGRAPRQPLRKNNRKNRQERTRHNSYTAQPSFHQDDLILPPPNDHFNQLEGHQLHESCVPPLTRRQPKDFSNPTQGPPPLTRREADDQSNPTPGPRPLTRRQADGQSNSTQRPQLCNLDVLPPDATRRKRKQPEDSSPEAYSKRQTLPVNPCASSAHRPSLRPQSSVRPGSLRSMVQRPRRKDRVRVNSYVAHPSIHDDPTPETPVNVNRVDNIEAWRSSVPPNMGCSSPPPHQHTDRMPDQSIPRAWNCESKEFLTHLRRIADTVEGIAMNGACSSNRNQRQAVSSRPSGGYRDLSLLARVRSHIRALLGKCMELNQFPPPATQREKAQWKRVLEDDSDDEEFSDDPDLEEEDGDPAFPYLNGPGHRDLSASALAIMWRSMRRAGVVSFRPDFSRGPRDVDNMFLWNLACSIFIKLVRAGEYEEIDLETSSEASIRQAILNHAKQLQRQYREAGWNPNRLDQRAVKKRRQERTRRLRDQRIKYISNKPGLAALIPVITECTSDAETVDEDEDSDDEMDQSEQPLKRVIVQSLPWRHPRLTRAFDMIDRLIELQRTSGCKDYGKPSHKRFRPREDAIKLSDRACAGSLPADCYDAGWLGSQTVALINSLKIQPSPDLTPIIRKLEDLVRSR